MSTEKKTALVLGGIKGIGKAVALGLGKLGMRVAINYFDWENFLPELEGDLANSGIDHLIMRNNLLDTDSIPKMVQNVVKQFGSLDVVINNIERGGWPIVHGKYTQDQWDLEIATTLRAKQWVFDAALPFLKASKNGHLINISSIAAIVGRSGPAAWVFSDGYAAASRGVTSFTETWARQAAPLVRVNEIMLGFFETRHGPKTRGWGVLSESQKQAIIDHTLLGRTGNMEDVVKAVNFLVKDAPFMTGSVLRIDGGYVLGADKAPDLPEGVVKSGENVFGR